MITCKEDLINTYIENDKGELRDLYFSAIERSGLEVKVDGLYRDYNLRFISVLGGCNCVQSINDPLLVRKCNELTLSDLKPEPKQFISKALEESIKETVSEQFADCVKRSPVSAECKWDLKGKEQENPRTKVEYEKANFEPEEIWKAFKEHQEVGFLYVKTSDEYECLLDGVFNLAMAISQGDQLYRKVERPVEWWEDAADFVRENACNMNAIARSLADDGLYVEAKMTRDQWCDFARILLEQEGE